MNPPRLEYIVATPPAIKLAVEAMWEGATNHTLWAAIPWDYVNPFCLGVLMALLLNDFRSNNSWLRENWKEYRSPFYLGEVVGASRTDPTRTLIRAKLTPKHDTRSSVVSVYGSHPKRGKIIDRFLICKLPSADRLKGEPFWVDIGSMMHSSPGWTPRHSVWGEDIGPKDLPADANSIIYGGVYLTEIRLGGWVEKFEIVVSNRSEHNEGFTFFMPADAAKLMED